ncbi:MAG: hypothetical protein JO009_08710, partial [Candidatus Eremiobacteraeota bacterium]|nr:hypothetical protein [Candidatus Eremiobacteraeota bacterium]
MTRAASRTRKAWFLAAALLFAFTTAGAAHSSEDPSPGSPQPAGAGATPAAAPTREPPVEVALPDLNKGVWVHGPNLPSPRQNAAAAVIAGRIYLIGGFGPRNEQMDTTLVWEPQVAGSPRGEAERAGLRLGLWTYAARIPEPVDHAAAVAVGPYIYVAGGRIENLVTNKFWRYDAGNDSWIELPSLPIPRFDPTMQAIGDKLYVIGGAVSHGNDATSMMVYDIATAQWSVHAYATPYQRAGAASVVMDDRIVLLGGRDEYDRNLPFCDLYDPQIDHWYTCTGMHTPRSDFGLSAVNNRLVAVGGDNLALYQPTQTVEISERDIDGWMSGLWMPSPRQGMAQVTLGNVIW